MSWEHNRYEAKCDTCGRQGFCVRSSDDWNRTATRWEGFDEVAPDATAVARMRVGPDDMSPKCPCGSTNISIGKHVSSS